MLVVDIVRLSTRMFRTNRSRTILTIAGIGVGIGAILFLVSLGYGLQKLILDKITNSDAILSLDVTRGEIEGLELTRQSVDDIKIIEGVDKISPLVSVQSQIVVDGIFSELPINFVDREYFKLDGTMLKEGEFYSDGVEDENKILISTASLKLFNINEEDVFNKDIEFSLYSSNDDGNFREINKLEQKFKVVGIIEEESSSYVYMPFSMSRLLENVEYTKLKVKVDNEESLDLVRNHIIDKGFMVSALSDIIEQANQVFNILKIVLASFGIVALVVSAIGMFNTMTIALLERTQEIGIMKALGATSLDVWSMFLSESVMIGFLGGLSGLLIGFSGGEIFNYGINTLAGAMGGEKIDLFFTPLWFSMLIMFFSTIVGLLTGFYPAKRAASINPLEALRYK